MDAVRSGDTFDKRYYLENLYRLFEGLPGNGRQMAGLLNSAKQGIESG